MITMRSRKPGAPDPKSPSPSEQNREVEQVLKRYNCTLSERLSERARLFGLEHGKTTCEVVDQAMEELLRKEREPESS
jgi:hypothetical protein